MSTIERLVDVLAAQYRWGLHPAKLFLALLVPVLIVWFADRRVRAYAKSVEEGGVADPASAESPPSAATNG